MRRRQVSERGNPQRGACHADDDGHNGYERTAPERVVMTPAQCDRQPARQHPTNSQGELTGSAMSV